MRKYCPSNADVILRHQLVTLSCYLGSRFIEGLHIGCAVCFPSAAKCGSFQYFFQVR